MSGVHGDRPWPAAAGAGELRGPTGGLRVRVGQGQPGPAFKDNNGTLHGQCREAPLNVQVLLKTSREVGKEWGENFISLSFLPFLIFPISKH